MSESISIHSQMTEERIKQLNDIDFEWTPTKDAWNDRFEELKVFKSQNGHCNVPYNYDANKSLGAWVSTQRYQHKQLLNGSHTHITEERIEKLESIGFAWRIWS